MKGSKSTNRTKAANNQPATPGETPAPADSPKQEAETTPVDAQTRHEMIAVVAYHLAEMRGFAAGCELDDWLCAEAEINAKLEQTPRLGRSE